MIEIINIFIIYSSMNTHTLITIGTCSVAMIGGYFIGNANQQPDRSADASTQSSQAPPNSLSIHNTSRSSHASSRSSLANRSFGSDPDKAQAIFQRASALLADSSMNSMDYRTYAEVWNLTQAMSSEELRDAITLLEEKGSTDQNARRLRMMLFSQWGAIDGRAAADFALHQQASGSRRDTSITGAISAWIKTDPAAAEAWYESNKDQLKKSAWTHASIQSMFIQSLAKHDLDAAFNKIDLSNTQQRRSAASIISRLIMEEDTRAGVIAKVQEIEDANLKHQMLRGMLNTLSYQDLDAAKALLGSIENTNDDNYGTYQNGYLRGLARTDPAAALEYASNEISNDRRRETSMRTAFARLAHTDADAAQTWLDNQAVDDRDKYYQSASSNFRRSNPETSMQWALKIADDNKRTDEVIRVFRQWRRQHQAGSEQWLNTLDPESQEAILSEVDRNHNAHIDIAL